ECREEPEAATVSLPYKRIAVHTASYTTGTLLRMASGKLLHLRSETRGWSHWHLRIASRSSTRSASGTSREAAGAAATWETSRPTSRESRSRSGESTRASWETSWAWSWWGWEKLLLKWLSFRALIKAFKRILIQ